jgi:solute carrier family 31 (copper transporter), member 1
MVMTFFTSARSSLYTTAWTPTNDGQYAGTCIFLIVLAVILRFVLALRPVLEAHVWNDHPRANNHFSPDHATIEQQKATSPISNSFSHARRDLFSRWSGWRVNSAAGRATYELVIAGIAYFL